MAYSGTYVADDLDDIAVDGIGTAGVMVISFITLIVLLLVGGFVYKRAKKK